MKSYSFIFLALICFNNLTAQFNRTNSKKSNPYRSDYFRMVAGGLHNLEIREGRLWAWGKNDKGQLGDGTRVDKNTPIQIGTDQNWISVATSGFHSLGLKSDGTLWAWGSNSDGQLGNGSKIDTSKPIQIGSAKNWISISAGLFHSHGIKSDGTLWAWGDNFDGQLGDGTTIDRTSPVQIGTSTNWTGIAAGLFHTCGLKSDGTLWTWGWNGEGQLGDGTNWDKYSPVQITSAQNWVSITCGNFHTLGIKSDGTLWAWGLNSYGQVGDGTYINKNIPIQISSAQNWVNIEGGSMHTLGIKSDGTLWAWGSNNQGQLGDGSLISKNIPNQIGTSQNWVSVSTGIYHTLGLKSDGTLWAWGDNQYGQIGDGNNTSKFTPQQTSIASKEWLRIAAGIYHTLGLKSNGTLWAWGNNQYGQLGDGTTVDKINPIQIGTSNNWVSIIAGGYHTLGLKSDGTLWAWGRNDFGQIGNGTYVNQSSPMQISSAQNWVSIVAGLDQSLGLKSDGTLWAWGHNDFGQLGDGSIINKNSPIQIGTSNNWVSLTAGFGTFGLKADGTIWGWGHNAYGQIGDGSKIDKYTPVKIGTNQNWISISAGTAHTLGIKSDGTLWAWGYNIDGELGDGTNINKSIPVQIGSATNWLTIAASSNHTVGLKSDGSYWGWGGNLLGQLGDGTNVNKNIPIEIDSNHNWISLATEYGQTFGLKSDRTKFCATGRNLYGELGDGTIINKNKFVCNSNCEPPPVPTNTTSKVNLTICQNKYTILNASGIGTLGWYSADTGGLYLGGGSEYTTKYLSVNSIFYVQDSTCISSSNRTPISVKVQNLPIVTASVSPTNVCSGSMITLYGGGTATSYVWLGGIINGVGFKPALTTNSYVVIGTDTNGCSDTAKIKIVVNPLPSVKINASDTSVCSGSSVILNGTGTATTYSWSGGISNGVSFIPVLISSSFTVTGTDSNNCSDTETITIKTRPLPNVSLILKGSEISAIEDEASYQWLFCTNNTLINGAKNQKYTAKMIGKYAVEVKKNNCVDTSSCVEIQLNKVLNATQTSQISIYPNPTNGPFAIESKEEGYFTIQNELGQIIQSINLNTHNNYRVKIENLNNGIYFVVGTYAEQQIKRKLIVQNKF